MHCGFNHHPGQLDSLCSLIMNSAQEYESSVVKLSLWEN